jgi:hypothetical protein
MDLDTRLATEVAAMREARQYLDHGTLPTEARPHAHAAADLQRRLQQLDRDAARLPLTHSTTRRPAEVTRTARRAGRRIASTIALGVVVTLNAITAICWPQVCELVASYL